MTKDNEDISRLLKECRMRLIAVICTVCVVCDIIPCPYVSSCIEKFFSYNFSDIIPIGIAMWVFSTGLITLFFNKKDECYMGITYNELCRIRFRNKYSVMESTALCFVLGMILPVFLKWPITMCLYIFLQFGFMIYSLKLLRELLEPEESNKLIKEDLNQYLTETIERLEEDDIFSKDYEIYGNKDILIWKVIRGTDLTLASNQSNLMDILKNSNLKGLSNHQANVMGWLIAKNILEAYKTGKISNQFIRDWFLDEECSIEIQKGILYALVETDNFKYNTVDFAFDLIDQTASGDDEKKNRLVVWFVTLFIVLKELYGHENKSIFTGKVTDYCRDYKRSSPTYEWNRTIQNEWKNVCKLLGCDPMKSIEEIKKVMNVT